MKTQSVILIVLASVGLTLFAVHTWQPFPPAPAVPPNAYTLSLTTPQTPAPLRAIPSPISPRSIYSGARDVSPAVFAPQAPKYQGDEVTCWDEYGDPGQPGYTIRNWRPRANGWCYRADAMPIQ